MFYKKKYFLELKSKSTNAEFLIFSKEYKSANEISFEYFFENFSKTEISVLVNFLKLQKLYNFPFFLIGKAKIYNVDEINEILKKNEKEILKKRK
jgi:hypothetical protein